MKNSILKNTLALLVGCFVALLILEVSLRMLHPLPSRIKGDKIVLPINQEYLYSNGGIKGVDSIVSHKKNSLGFRGPELDSANKDRIKIFFVGGSTTECTACKDGDDWPLFASSNLQEDKYWINNAGLDGHSTYGHLILVQDYLLKLKPDYIAFLVGVNDMGRKDLSKFENFHLLKKQNSLLQKTYYNSSIVQLIRNWKAKKQAIELDLGHKTKLFNEWEKLEQDSIHLSKFIQEEEQLLENYTNRISTLGKLCLDNGINPIFITQPTIMGAGFDKKTGVNFDHIKIREYNGKNFDYILNLYNDVLRKYCQQNDFICIDLWEKLEKNSDYFYDEVHFTKKGSRQIGRLVSKSLGNLYTK